MSRFLEWCLKWIYPNIPVPMPSTDNYPHIPVVVVPPPPVVPVVEALLWDTPHNAYHSTRVLCDEAGLTLEEKNLICACIYQESTFHNTAKNQNKKNGVVLSTDWGICQVNDYYHIGEHNTSNGPVKLDFASVEYVVANPDKAVKFMINCYKRGNLKMWVSYSSGAFKRWLLPTSPMWLLKL